MKIEEDNNLEKDLPLSQDFCFPIYAASNLMQRIYRPLLDAMGLTYSQYLVMLVLWEREPILVSEIQERLYLNVGTISPMITRMEQSNLVVRVRDRNDLRHTFVALTPHGRSLKERGVKVPKTISSQLNMNHSQIMNSASIHKSIIYKILKMLRH